MQQQWGVTLKISQIEEPSLENAAKPGHNRPALIAIKMFIFSYLEIDYLLPEKIPGFERLGASRSHRYL